MFATTGLEEKGCRHGASTKPSQELSYPSHSKRSVPQRRSLPESQPTRCTCRDMILPGYLTVIYILSMLD
eukprot:356367-Chlamydomonas_euryale.AAC.5